MFPESPVLYTVSIIISETVKSKAKTVFSNKRIIRITLMPYGLVIIINLVNSDLIKI